MKKTFISLSLMLLISLMLLTISSCQKKDHSLELEVANSRIDSLSAVLAKEKQRADSLMIGFERSNNHEEYPIFFGKKFKDIDHPEEFIKNGLNASPDMIPLKPVLGGTMHFQQIEILTEKWLLAVYEDGHIQGKAIMEYEMQSNGQLDFTIITTQE